MKIGIEQMSRQKRKCAIAMNNHGGKRKGAGRKPLGSSPMKRVVVTLSDAHITKASNVGQGNLSAGLRLAVDKLPDVSERPSE